jgi:hypothetical protein
MADDHDADGAEEYTPPTALPQHPLVSRLRPDPVKPPKAVIELVGLPGRSAREGYQRLYLTPVLDYFAEFLVEDVLYATALPLEQSPFPGHQASLVGVRREAAIDYTWTRTLQPIDEFDLDVRLGAPTSPEASTPVVRSGQTSCAPCYSMGISCTMCPSMTCPPPRTRHCPK